MITSTTRDQVLTRLCGHIAPAEELARKDDLVLLFSAVTSWCPIHNSVWRRSAGEVLMTISRCSLTPAVVRYVHEKGKLAFEWPNIFNTIRCDNLLVFHCTLCPVLIFRLHRHVRRELAAVVSSRLFFWQLVGNTNEWRPSGIWNPQFPS